MAEPENVVAAATGPFRLGVFEVRPEAHELVGPSGTARLPRLQMALLLRLVADAGRPVTRETLIADVWPRRGVTDEVLSRAIADLRNALGDDAKRPAYLETLPKLGYRLKALPEAMVPALPPRAPGAVEPAPGQAMPSRAPRRRIGLRTVTVVVAIAVASIIGVTAWRTTRGDGVDAIRSQLATETAFASDVETEFAPRFSPDGRSIAFSTGDDVRSRIVVRDRGGRTLHTVSRDPGFAAAPVFFPDGERIAYWFRTASDCGIVERRLADGHERPLVRCAMSPLPRFDVSPDGHAIVYATRAAERPTALMHLDVAGGRVRELTRPEPGAGDDALPRFSPDGRRIAFFRGNDAQRELHVMALTEGSTPVRATDQRGLSYGAAWIDDRSLLVAADWFGFRALNHVNLATGEATLLGARGARFPDIDRRGDIVHELATFRANLWRVAFDGSNAEVPLWPASRYTNQAAISPSGTSIAFMSNRDGALAPYLAAPGGEARRLIDDEANAYMRPRFSADAKTLYAVAMPHGTRGPNAAVAIDVASGRVAKLPLAVDRVWDVSPASDGTLIVGEGIGQAARLYRAPSGTPQRLERLPLPIVSHFVVDGSRIAFSQPQLKGLTLCTLPALDCKRLDVPIGDDNRFDWALSPNAVWYANGATLVRYDLASGTTTRRVLEGNAPIGTITVAPDERFAIVSREDRAEIDLMLAPRAR